MPIASSATLTSLRSRVRTQLQNASGFTEPLVVTTSSETLTTLRDRVELALQDSSNETWATADIDEAIEQALDQYSAKQPHHAIGTITLSAAGREISLSSLTGLIRVERVWWDYDSSTPGYPPNWRQFEVWPGSLLYIDDDSEPANGDVVRVWYTKMHTLSGLNGASSTTFPAEDITYIIDGAASICAEMRAVEIAEDLNVDSDVVDRLMKYADEKRSNFRYGMNLRPPAWQRYAYGYDQGDIDEALRWALHRYSEVSPDRYIDTVELSAAGREVDISGITDYIEIERVWWDYTSTDPEHPPNWRDFEVWPGDVLYIKDPDEPQSGDVVRIWYTRRHTMNGLDSATSTTFPEDAETLLVIGASGFSAQERVQELEGRSTPTKLREWAQARLREFERGLKWLARRNATLASGIAPGPTLDRWEGDSGWW
jgi:hypothetical protein